MAESEIIIRLYSKEKTKEEKEKKRLSLRNQNTEFS